MVTVLLVQLKVLIVALVLVLVVLLTLDVMKIIMRQFATVRVATTEVMVRFALINLIAWGQKVFVV